MKHVFVSLVLGVSWQVAAQAPANEVPYNSSIAIPLSSIVNATPGVAGEKIVEIKPGQVSFIDQSVDVGELKINGQLHCVSSPSLARIKAKTIYVNGVFQCGTVASRFSKKLEILLKHNSAVVPKNSFSYRGMIVNAYGKLTLNGSHGMVMVAKLNATLEKNVSEIVLDRNVNTVWKLNDEIAIAPTSYHPGEGESFIIVGFPAANRVKLNRVSTYRHYGRSQNFATSRGTITLDQRAEVINLTRNIVIKADESAVAISDADLPDSQLGGHVMVHKGGGAWIDSVEFSRMGQAGIMARYPFHWHLAGNVPGQYIRNSSIHKSFQRCITVHQTNQATVDRNSCFNFKGHGFFLETGNEVNNVITNNIGIGAKAPSPGKILLASDNPKESESGVTGMRFPAVSVFWISHPQNIVKNNIAAGSVGTGFWMTFIDEVREYVNGGYNGAVLSQPNLANTTEFHNNIAHSTLVGHTWDGGPDLNTPTNNPNNPMDRRIGTAHYKPQNIPVFRNLVAWKNANVGIYFRGHTAVFENAVLADNGWQMFFAYNQIARNSLVIGRSANHGPVEDNYLYTLGKWPRKQFGIVMYDGPFELDGVDFMNYPSTKLTKTIGTSVVDVTPVPIATIGGARKYTNFSQRLRFSPEPYYRMYDDAGFEVAGGKGWLDNLTSNSLRDIDGSLTGQAGSLLVSNNNYLTNSSCFTKTASYTGFRICPSGFQTVNLFLGGTSNINKIPFMMVKDGTSSLLNYKHLDNVSNQGVPAYLNKAGLITSSQHTYDMLFRRRDIASGVLSGLSFHTNSEKPNLISPVVKLHALGTNCKLDNGAVAVSSLDALRASTHPGAYYSNGTEFYVKFKTTNPETNLINPAAAYPGKGLTTGNGYAYSCAGSVQSRIMGTIDNVKIVGSNVEFYGWACDYGQDVSVDIHIYLKGTGVPDYGFSIGKTSVLNEPAVSVACGSAHGAYRFKAVRTLAQMAPYKGRTVNVHGISVTGGPNNLLSNSGRFTIP